MLEIIKGNSGQWKLLMQVLTQEIADDDPEFVAWLEADEDHQKLYKILKAEKDHNIQLFNPKKMYKKVRRELFGQPHWQHLTLTFLKYAAVILAFFLTSFSIYYFAGKRKSEFLDAQKIENSTKTIEPGSKKALLVLEDGSSIELKNEFELKKGNGSTVIDNDTSGMLTYKQLKQEAKPEFHVIKVPLGGEYELKLSDGTKVFINSGSTLRFPSFFSGDTRKVELTGEAFFEVTKSVIPFIVQASGTEIRVLGTSFNVSAYNEDPSINATLVTGSILMKTASNEKGYQLYPGQNLDYEKASERVKVESVDTDIYTAWTHGEYVFRNQTMEDILSRLSRWYDFTIEFNNQEVKKIRFSGSVEKKRPIAYFFNQIEQVTNIKFKQYGNMIEVY